MVPNFQYLLLYNRIYRGNLTSQGAYVGDSVPFGKNPVEHICSWIFFNWTLFGRSLVSFAMSFFPAVKITLKEMPLFEKYDNWIASKALSCSHCEKEGSLQHFVMAELCAMYRSWKSKQKRCVTIIETVCTLNRRRSSETLRKKACKENMQTEGDNHCPVLNRPEGNESRLIKLGDR